MNGWCLALFPILGGDWVSIIIILSSSWSTFPNPTDLKILPLDSILLLLALDLVLVMESDESAFINNMLAPPMAPDKRTKRYFASSSHGHILFEQDLLATSSMQASDAQLMGDPLEARSLVASIGMTPAGFEMREGEIVSRGYHALGGTPVDIAPAPQPQIESSNKPTAFKGPWTMEEDR